MSTSSEFQMNVKNRKMFKIIVIMLLQVPRKLKYMLTSTKAQIHVYVNFK